MQDTTAQAYLRTKVMTASPAELRLMLLDGAIKFAAQAREGLEAQDYERSYSGFSQCRAIILELINGIRAEHDPDLAERVRSLYLFLYSELVESSFEKDPPRLSKVIELLEYERETWMLLMEKMNRESGTPAAASSSGPGSGPASGGPASGPGSDPGTGSGTPRSLSVQA